MENLFEWKSPEHRLDRKSSDWYWGFGIICTGITVLAFYFGNFLFGIFVIIAGFTLGYLSYKDTPILNVEINARGIIFGSHIYLWRSYQSFWIEDEHIHGPHLLLRPLSNITPLIIIPISEEIDLDELRETMLHFLDEEYLQESLIHKWFDKILAM